MDSGLGRRGEGKGKKRNQFANIDTCPIAFSEIRRDRIKV